MKNVIHCNVKNKRGYDIEEVASVVSKKYRTDPRSVPRYFSEERYRTAIHFQTAGKEWDRNGNSEKDRTDPLLLKLASPVIFSSLIEDLFFCEKVVLKRPT